MHADQRESRNSREQIRARRMLTQRKLRHWQFQRTFVLSDNITRIYEVTSLNSWTRRKCCSRNTSTVGICRRLIVDYWPNPVIRRLRSKTLIKCPVMGSSTAVSACPNEMTAVLHQHLTGGRAIIQPSTGNRSVDETRAQPLCRWGLHDRRLLASLKRQ